MSERTSIHERFWAKVNKTDTCWLWTASVNENGYGRIGLGTRADGTVLAHRLAYEMLVGPIPDGMGLDHQCHTPACVNPAHLKPSGQVLNGQNRAQANKNSATGVRGVHWDKRRSKFEASAYVAGKTHRAGFFDRMEDAERAVIALRRRVMPNSLMDRAD